MTEVAITLRPAPSLPFRDEGSTGAEPNQLILTIDPSHSTSLKLVAKIPGPRMRLRTLTMDALQPPHVPDAYGALLLDSLRGDQTLFPRRDEVELRWRLVEPLLQAWRDAPDAPEPYAAGTQGPASAGAALAPGHRWRAL
jgi:glucose-6-phosphate 1-dehydrogenase